MVYLNNPLHLFWLLLIEYILHFPWKMSQCVSRRPVFFIQPECGHGAFMVDIKSSYWEDHRYGWWMSEGEMSCWSDLYPGPLSTCWVWAWIVISQCSNTARRAMVKPAAHLLLNLFLHPLTLGAKLNHIPCWHKSTKIGHVAETVCSLNFFLTHSLIFSSIKATYSTWTGIIHIHWYLS